MFGSNFGSLPGFGLSQPAGKKIPFLPEPPVIPPSPRPPVRPPEPGCSTLPVTPTPAVPSVKKAQRVSKK
jgi:hypothetical protein